VEVSDVDVNIDSNKDLVTVKITGQVAAPLGMFNSFEIGAEGPYERFVNEEERGR